MAAPATVLDRRDTPRGEIALRRRDGAFEVIADGVFLMSSAGGGASERLLVEAALDAAADPRRVLIGGLGLGFSLRAALADPRVAEVTVVEIEPAVIDWHATHLRPLTGGALADPRVELVCGDVVDVVAAGTRRADAICLDVDNGPGWTVTARNAWLYDDAGLAALHGMLPAGGALAVWSAHAAPGFAARLRRRFPEVAVRTVAVPRGEPDHVYVAAG